MEVHGCSDVGPLIDTDCGLSLLPWSWGRFFGTAKRTPSNLIFQTRPLLWAHELRQRCADQRRDLPFSVLVKRCWARRAICQRRVRVRAMAPRCLTATPEKGIPCRSGTVPAWVYSGAIVAGAVPGHGPAQEKWPAKQIAFWLVVPA
jgi:hypothetical protein